MSNADSLAEGVPVDTVITMVDNGPVDVSRDDKEPFSSAYATSRICNTWMALASCPARQGQQRSFRRIRQDLSQCHLA
jgi:hypothetical protein